MKKGLLLLSTILCLLLFGGCASGDKSGDDSQPPVSDAVTITFDYIKQSGYASNQFAVWIEDTEGNMVKTLYATRFTANGGYKNRTDAIPTWVEKSGLASMEKAEIDAITGPTPKSGTLSYVWDLKDESGNRVAPGKYTFCVEGSLRWKNRVLYSGTIEVGDSQAAAQAEAKYFYEASADQQALTDQSPENAMLGKVTAAYIPAEK